MYQQVYWIDGRLTGVKRLSDGLVIPKDPNNPDWQEFLTWNAVQPVPLDLSDRAPTIRVPRPLPAIQTSLQALTSAQQTAVWNDMSAGNPMKILTSHGSGADSIFVIHSIVTDLDLTGTALTRWRLRAVAIYVRDNPTYLVNPPFAPTVNVPGDMLAP